MTGRIIPYVLNFKKPAGTSRGILQEKITYFIELTNEAGFKAYGECGVFPGLSAEYGPAYEARLMQSMEDWQRGNLDLDDLKRYPSIVIGWETALLNLAQAEVGKVFNSAFWNGNPLTINGLVWMGTAAQMEEQVNEKIQEGFRCIKLKVGAIGWEAEHALLQGIRKQFNQQEMEIRVDANGAFAAVEAPRILEQLAALQVHSIEQPIKAGQHEEMAKLIAASPLPIALDEELIGIHFKEDKIKLLDQLRPAYIILKPTLHGGFRGSNEWISLAEKREISWWATSALESNIGLNAIAQWVSTKRPALPQGLGTGSLYTNNIEAPLEVRKGQLRYLQGEDWHLALPG